MGESPEFCLAGREEIKIEAWIANAQVRVHRNDMPQTFLQLQVMDLRIACHASSKSTIIHLKASVSSDCVARKVVESKFRRMRNVVSGHISELCNRYSFLPTRSSSKSGFIGIIVMSCKRPEPEPPEQIPQNEYKESSCLIVLFPPILTARVHLDFSS